VSAIIQSQSWHAHRYAVAAMSTTSTASVPAPPLLPLPAPSTPPPKRVSLADRVARAFPPLACVRGFRYFARRRVDLANVSEAGLDADVKGQRVQHVRLRVQDGRLASGCTCAARVLGPAACRHVWATLLEIDRQGAFESLRSTHRALALTALDGPLKRRKAKSASETDSAPSKTQKPRGRVRGRT
jgi:uncharacterized Zn finger protein